ncbi:ABC transporter permease [Spirochaetia bacterium]|nr:ABC transporter permease [Spirochaetia bacterium]
MKFITILLLALKYLFRYRRRYLFLFLALTFGFGIVTLITSIKDGMYENVYNSAQGHYAGDIITVGYDKNTGSQWHMEKNEMDNILQTITDTDINAQRVVMRTQFGNEGKLYYNGSVVRLKYVIGVDWDNEAAYFDSLVYQGRHEEPLGEDDIMLSAPVAEALKARVGDRLILETQTRYGQSNTGAFVVGGIVDDSTLFGYYKAYISRPVLNTLLLYGEDECSSIGIFLNDRREMENKKVVFHDALEKRIPVGPLVKDRDELQRETYQSWSGIKTFVITIPVYLSEVSDLLDAMNIITYFLYGMMLVIILVSAMVTYRLILHERSREVGTMRAIGFYAGDVQHILVIETIGLGVLSLLAGFIFALLGSALIRLVPLSWFPSFEIFMKDGSLTPLYQVRTILINLISVFGILLAAVWFPAFRSSRDPLPQMLSGGKG